MVPPSLEARTETARGLWSCGVFVSLLQGTTGPWMVTEVEGCNVFTQRDMGDGGAGLGWGAATREVRRKARRGDSRVPKRGTWKRGTSAPRCTLGRPPTPGRAPGPASGAP